MLQAMSNFSTTSERDDESMPALHAQPLVLAHMLGGLDGSDRVSPETLEWVLCDPALTAQVLASEAREVPGRQEFISLLEGMGAEYIDNWIATASVKMLSALPISTILQDWNDSLTCAHFCSGLAGRLGYPNEFAAYLAGLFHNLDHYLAGQGFSFPSMGHSSLRVARWVDNWGHWATLSSALLAQDEREDRLKEALPLAKLLRVARAVVYGEGEAYRLAAELLPELNADELDAVRREADSAVSALKQRLGFSDSDYPNHEYTRPLQDRLAASIEEYFLIRQCQKEFGASRSEAQLLEAAMKNLGRQAGVKRPLYLVRDGGANALVCNVDSTGEGHGLRIEVKGSNSAAAWAVTSRVPVVFSTLDTESVSLLDIQLARECGSTNVVAIPVGDFEIEGVLVGCVNRDQAARLENSVGYLSKLGRIIGSGLKRIRAQEESTDILAAGGAEDFKARVRRAAHEINNPLGIAKNYLAILGAKLGDQNPVAGEVGIIREELDRIPRILRALTTDKNGAQVDQEVCNLNDVVRDLALVAESAIPFGRNVRISTQLEQGLPDIRTDPGKLKQLLLNLTLNALEASPNEGSVRLETFTNLNHQGRMQQVIAIKDNGPGIPRERMPTLFEPVDSAKGGQHSGLGLAIVKSLASELGMTVTCTSNDSGTTFQVASAMN